MGIVVVRHGNSNIHLQNFFIIGPNAKVNQYMEADVGKHCCRDLVSKE